MRPLPFLLGLTLLSAPLGLGAAEIDAEDFRRLNDRVNSHDEAIDAYRGTIQELRSEISRLRLDNDRLRTQVNSPRNYATQEQITKLADQIREVEKNRAADKTQILDAFDKLKSLPPVVVPQPPTPRPSGATKAPEKGTTKDPGPGTAGTGDKSPSPAVDPAMEYYEHTLGEGETLSAVMDAYNKQHGLKIRLAHVLKANPSIKDPKKLRVGQKLRIPVVK
jgi:regulator of replication initiation timing